MTQDLKKRINDLKQKLDIKKLKAEIKEIEAEASEPDFWQDHKLAGEKMKKLAQLQEEVKEIEALEKELEAGKLDEKKLEKFELKIFLSGKYDANEAIVSIHAGQGGTEACDWAQMLERMYIRFFEKKGWDYEVIGETPGEEAGIKKVTLLVSGSYAYGNLKFEKGTHRLVRQSPFNADRLRQTSFALVEVLPRLKEEIDLKIRDEDIKFESFRASGHGGQNINKVSTAVRLTHIPTGISVESQAERYQERNRKLAMELLKAKLWQKEEEKRQEKMKKIKGEYKKASWGNQIRSYVLHPYKMVKDLRTGYQESDPDSVLDGNLDGFIEKELRVLS